MNRSAIPRSTKPINKRRKPRRGRVIDKKRLEWAAKQPCQITGEFPATTHHVRFCGSSRDDTRIIRLVARLHMKSSFGYVSWVPCVEDGKEVFEAYHKVSIDGLVDDLRKRYEQAGWIDRAAGGKHE